MLPQPVAVVVFLSSSHTLASELETRPLLANVQVPDFREKQCSV